MSYRAPSVCLAILIVSLGCTAPKQDAASPSVAPTVAVAQSCSAGAASAGLARYRNAMSAAHQRAQNSSCDDATVAVLASHAGASVAACAAFGDTIRTGADAAELRAGLGSNLALAVVTGKLNPGAQWAGLETTLNSGIMLYGPVKGVFGNASRLEFSAGGKGTFKVISLDDKGASQWISSPFTWRVGQVRGKDVELVLSGDGLPTAPVVLKRERYFEPKQADAPYFTVMVGEDRFDSIPDECSA
jgi:hypothetical protein